ncbi:MAG TPA: sigma-54 dependent transcriptional regulator [Pyrinomonadaceae bacterium]|jgi:transcriptional regulator with PAS, ATPase and Fis domain
MTLAETLLHQLDNQKLNRDERARLRCQLAEELEDRGQYEAACNALGELWQGIGIRPTIEGFSEDAAAEVLLRTGTLSGWLGSAGQITDAQASAKDLITESITLFESLGETLKATAARSDMTLCYWREGAFDEARALLEEVFSHLDEKEDIKVRARTLLRRILVEVSTGKLNDALCLLTDNASIFESSEDQILKGRFHGQLAIVLMGLGTAEHRNDYMDRAVIEFSAASYHFEQAGHTHFRAPIENNLGFLLFTMGRYDEADYHLNHARRLFVAFKNSGRTAQVDETRTRLLLAQGRNTEAEKVIRGAIQTLEKGGEQSHLAVALTTQGVVLARLGRYEKSYEVLRRAMNIAEQAGALENAGRAALTLLEEHGERMPWGERREVYGQADGWLSGTQDAEDISRLRACARRVAGTGKAEVRGSGAGGSFVHACGETAELLEKAQLMARSRLPILITGETGVGKEVLARLIHEWSGRAGAFVPINCGALTETLIESQLFGHRKGSFTDAVVDYRGAVREAEGGTLLLDEIGELSGGNQGKLLRLIELGEIMPVGAPAPEYVDVRIIASTNARLSEMVARHRFREDLFYRVGAFEIEIPPLRERPRDLIALARHFIEQIAEREGRQVTFTPGSLEALQSLPLYGNARELRTIIERAVITSGGQPIREEMFKLVLMRATGKGTVADPWGGFSLQEEVRLYEERLIERALKDAHGRVTHAARLLGLSHQTLSAIIESRHKRLLQIRTPVQPRRRSIIKRR